MSEKMIFDEVNYTLNKYSARTFEECGFISEEFADLVVKKIEDII